MISFALVDKNNGNVDYIMTWNADKLTDNYVVADDKKMVQIENYNNDFQNYGSYDFNSKQFHKKIQVAVNKKRTLFGGNIDVTVIYPDKVNELVHLSIGSTKYDINVVDGKADFSCEVNEVGMIQIKAESTSSYGYNMCPIEILE